ncbi:MAG: hypothetical protein ACFFD4_01725 [Candidatus Odinarchaeota archaeon]
MDRKEDHELRKRVLFLSILLLCAGLAMENHQTSISQENSKIVSAKTSGTYTLAYGDNQTFEYLISEPGWVIEWSFSSNETEVGISVYLMNNSEFDSFNSTGTVPDTAMELSDGNQTDDSGVEILTYADSWYVVFINDDSDQITADVDIMVDAFEYPITSEPTGTTTTTTPSPPSAPGLLFPGDGATITNATPTLDWADVTGAEAYQVQVAESVSFSPLLVNETTSSSQFSMLSALLDNMYHWRVRATNSIAGAGDWSDSRSFTVSAGGSDIIVALLLEVPGHEAAVFPGLSAESGYWYAVNLTADTEYEFELSAGSSANLDLDAKFAIYDEEGKYLVGDSLHFPASFTFTPEVDKIFYIHVIPVKFDSGDIFILKISVIGPAKANGFNAFEGLTLFGLAGLTLLFIRGVREKQKYG